MKYATEEAFVGANAFGKGAANTAYAQYFVGNSYLNPLTDPQVTALQEGLSPVAVKEMVYQATDYLAYGRALPFLHAANNAAFLTKVVLQCLPYIGYPPSLNAMGCIAKAAKQ